MGVSVPVLALGVASLHDNVEPINVAKCLVNETPISFRL